MTLAILQMPFMILKSYWGFINYDFSFLVYLKTISFYVFKSEVTPLILNQQFPCSNIHAAELILTPSR